MEKVGTSTLSLNLFDYLPLKQVEVDVIQRTQVIPVR